jgi:predicted ribosomally synthesized peptide with nif11-like leader
MFGKKLRKDTKLQEKVQEAKSPEEAVRLPAKMGYDTAIDDIEKKNN